MVNQERVIYTIFTSLVGLCSVWASVHGEGGGGILKKVQK